MLILNKKIEKGLCQCGCGQETSISKQNNLPRGLIKGQPVYFIKGHANRGRPGPAGPKNGNWRGGKTSSLGYVLITKPDYPRANRQGYVREHVLITERVLGKPLPEGVVIHHVNENRADNRKENLVICESQAYHALLHQRLNAYKATGNPHYKKCRFCKRYDYPERLYISPNGKTCHHRSCVAKYNREQIRHKNIETLVLYQKIC